MVDNRLRFIRDRLYNRVLDLRSVERLVNAQSFELAWNAANTTQKEKVATLIETLDCSGIKQWVRSLNQASLSIRELKERASQLGIPCYSRMDKQALLTAIYSKEDANGRSISNGDSGDSSSAPSSVGNPLSFEAGRNHLQEGQTTTTDRKAAI